jgi:phosphomannomutase
MEFNNNQKNKTMKTKELQAKINEMSNNEGINVELHNFLDNFKIVYKTGNSYTGNLSARVFDHLGSCTNSFIECEDGYVEYPF